LCLFRQYQIEEIEGETLLSLKETAVSATPGYVPAKVQDNRVKWMGNEDLAQLSPRSRANCLTAMRARKYREQANR
jgi:hypothetical protein